MHAVKVDSRKIMAIGLVIVAVFAAVAITVNLFYLGQIQSLVRNTTTTSVMELATARAHYLDECLASDQNSVKSLAHFIADVTPGEARAQVEDFISTHEAAAAWIRSKDGTTWCSSSETDLYDPALENELFGPALAGETGSSEMYLGHAGERRILFYAPIVDEPVASGPGTTAAPANPDDILGAVCLLPRRRAAELLRHRLFQRRRHLRRRLLRHHCARRQPRRRRGGPRQPDRPHQRRR